MTCSPKKNRLINQNWVEGELRLVNTLDNQIISLLRAIDQTGSITLAAKQLGLSYKGAWQMIARANNIAPKVLIITAIGGSKGGGTRLSVTGRSLLLLFTRLELQHKQFLQQLNRSLVNDPDIMRLLEPLTIKTSSTNQLLGTIAAIQAWSSNIEVSVELKGGEQIIASLSRPEFKQLELGIGSDVLLLINATEILIVAETDNNFPSTHNNLLGTVVLVRRNNEDSVVAVQLASGDSLTATISGRNTELLGLTHGIPVYAVFENNAVILGALSQPAQTAKKSVNKLRCCCGQ
ncbi:TOBE domain-containing protein [Candidatus Methylobacter oryzae]|uniref:LysR family transcriptional regulator n=1 Tax=Candidatus Methylobacter oryzae TaxID=2497749 RepID=A0ABY3C4I1_9GAMM|nr:TOBE domain-containing protein [Candidatus Methylobacter oryzae]TRW89620.1 LysR family transcriptional regulator [Candidatus Methylobacter oryzae]